MRGKMERERERSRERERERERRQKAREIGRCKAHEKPSFQPVELAMGPVRKRHSSHDFGWQSSHSVDLAGWQAKMASIEIWIP